jgi:ABC-type nitrate/sulfonate/bicarbonate transport system substrate-binding protein
MITRILMHRAFRLSAILIAGLVPLAACSAPAPTPTSAPPPTSAPVATNAPATTAPTAAPTAAPSPTQGAPVKVNSAWVAITGNQAPAWLAKEGGIFAKYGLDVNLSFVQGSSTATSSLLSGSLDIVQQAGPAVVNAASQGGDVVMFAGFLNISVFKLLVDPSIKTLADLKGKTIAITRFGSSDEFILRKILRDNGMDPAKDVKITQANDASGQMAALKNKSVDAVLLSPPNDVVAQKQGASVLIDTIPLNIPYQAIGLATTRKYLASNRATALNFLKAEIDAIRRFKTDRAFAEATMGKYLQTTDSDVLSSSWEAYSKSFADIPYPSISGLQEILDESNITNIKPSSFVDSTLVKELEDTGYFKK